MQASLLRIAALLEASLRLQVVQLRVSMKLGEADKAAVQLAIEQALEVLGDEDDGD